MTRMFAITVAVAAIMAAVSAAEAAGCGNGSTTLGHGRQCYVQLAQSRYYGTYNTDHGDSDFDNEDDDEDDDEDEYVSGSIIVEDIEDCEPGLYRMVELGGIEVPVACH
jgi:opacity protein-like surface antigen